MKRERGKARHGVSLLWILLLAVVVLAFSGCRDADQKEILQHINLLESGQGRSIYTITTANARELYGEEGIVERTDEVYSQMQVREINYKQVRLDRGASEADRNVYHTKMVLTSDYGVYEKDQTLTFVKDPISQQWQLQWEPANILPGLTTENDIVIETTPAARGIIYDRNGKIMAQDGPDGERLYPYGQKAASLIGFVRKATPEELMTRENRQIAPDTPVGRLGLELAYDEKLQARYGVQVFLSDQEEAIFSTEAQKGEDLHTTIDMRLQEAAYDAIDGEWGAVVALHPTTGQVLGLVSAPDYRPENWQDPAMTSADYHSNVHAGVSPNGGIFAYKYTPGSTQKLFTTLIGFQTGVLTPESSFEIYGSRWQPDNSWGGYTVHRVISYNGIVDLENALVLSDNIFFARTGLAIGAEGFKKGMEDLGIGQEVPCAIPIEKSQTTESDDLYRDVALADSAYGQYEVQITPMQMAMSYTLLMNNGTIMKPRLLLEETPEPWITDTATPEQLSFMNQAFRDVVAQNHTVANRDYGAFSGKTGTAEVGPGGKTNLGWFAGYDQDNPTAVFCVMINHVEKRGGSDIPCMYFGRIMDVLYEDGPYNPDLNPPEESAEVGA